jgi:hypothetical protein
MTRALLQQALESLELRCGTNAEERGPNGTITAIRKYLEQPEDAALDAAVAAEQEPVRLISTEHGDVSVVECIGWLVTVPTPPERRMK